MRTSKIILADDHSMVRGGLNRLLNNQDEFEVITSLESADQVIGYLKTNNDIDLLISDIKMPGSNMLDYLNEVNVLKPDLKVIIFSIHEEKEYVLKALSLNVNGYIGKGVDDDLLINGIRSVLKGESCFSNNILKVITSTLNQNEEVKNLTKGISEREKSILNLTIQGLSSIEIGEKLFISNKTVAVHRHNLMKKLNVKNTASLIRFAMEHNMS